MDPAELDELATDPTLGVPVPFACTDSAAALDGRRVTQCALSRICGVCGRGLRRPIAFIGSQSEADRNAFHFPPTHLDCAVWLLARVRRAAQPVLGQAMPAEWVLVTTAGFEFVRPARDDLDRRPTFQPNSVLTTSSG
jgi:hypothetical protein